MLVELGDAICLPPSPPQRPKRLVVPTGSWDCHAHVIGAPPAHPYVKERHFTPFPVSADDFLAVLDAEGFARGVLVQVSVHGTNNDYLLGALRQHRQRLVGVAVIDKTIPDTHLSELKQAGVVGIRLLEAKGGVGTDDLEWFGDRCNELGWSMQLCIPAKQYADLLPRLLKLRAPIVIDHMGWFDVEETVKGRGFQAVLHLLRETNTWLKMSGAFRLSQQRAPYPDVIPFMRELIRTAPERLVWGSDWPHVAIVDKEKMPQYGELLDGLMEAIGDPDVIRNILVGNPNRLYGAKLS